MLGSPWQQGSENGDQAHRDLVSVRISTQHAVNYGEIIRIVGSGLRKAQVDTARQEKALLSFLTIREKEDSLHEKWIGALRRYALQSRGYSV